MGDVPPSIIASCVPCEMQAVLAFVAGVVLAIIVFVALHHLLKD